MKRIPAVLAACLVAAGAVLVAPVSALALAVPMDAARLAARADSIVEVKVVSAKSRRAEMRSARVDRAPIVTDSALRVVKTIKGAPRSWFTLTQLGGTVGGLSLAVSEVPQLSPGDRAILFLDENGVVGGEQGCLRVVDGHVPALGGTLSDAERYLRGLLGQPTSAPLASAEQFAAASSAVSSSAWATTAAGGPIQSATAALASYPTITSVNPSTANAGIGAQITIYGSGFGSTAGIVSFPLGTSGGPAFATVSSWTDTAITCNVPSGAESGLYVIDSAGNWSSKFAYHVGFDWTGVKATAPVTYRVNENTSDLSAAAVDGAIDRAMRTWNAAGAKFSFARSGRSYVSTYQPPSDGNNDIFFTSSGFSSGVLAMNLYWFDSSKKIIESDIFINDAERWSDGAVSGAFDLETGVLHELGHTVGLGDQYDDYAYGEVMSSEAAGSTRRTLSSAELDGIRYLYGTSDTVAPTTPTLTSPSHPVDTDWYRSLGATVEFASTDNVKVTGYSYVFDHSATTDAPKTANTTSASVTKQLAEDGEWWVHVRARDASGNWSATAHRRLRIDVTPPKTTAAVASPYATSATIAIAASDSHTSVSETEVTLDGASAPSDSVTTSEEGTHTLAFASVDALGNRESTQTVTFVVTGPPVADPVATGSGVLVEPGEGASVVVTAPVDVSNPSAGSSSAAIRFSSVSAGGRATLARGSLTAPFGWRAFGRSWHLAFSGSVSPTVGVTLPYEPLLTGPRAARLRVLQWDGESWRERAPVADTKNHALTVTLASSDAFSPLVIAEPSSVSRASRLIVSGNANLKPAYGAKAFVAVWLKDAFGAVLPGRSVTLRRADGSIAATLKSSGTSPGYYTGYAPVVRSRTVFSAKFAGDSANSGTSLSVTVVPKAKLGVNAPELPRRYRTFYVTGTISPAHSKAAVKFEAWKRNSKGVYYRYKTYSVTTSSSSFRKSFKLPSGRYRFRTTHEDSSHAYSTSGWDYIRVQ